MLGNNPASPSQNFSWMGPSIYMAKANSSTINANITKKTHKYS